MGRRKHEEKASDKLIDEYKREINFNKRQEFIYNNYHKIRALLTSDYTDLLFKFYFKEKQFKLQKEAIKRNLTTTTIIKMIKKAYSFITQNL